MAMGMPCVGGRMLTGGTTSCAGTVVKVAFGCAGAPGSTVLFAVVETSFVRFVCSWGTGFVVTRVLIGTNPCRSGVDETIVSRFLLGLI